LGPGVTVNALDTTATLQLANGPLVFEANSALNVPYVQWTTGNATYVAADSGATGTLGGILTGTTSGTLVKGGAGQLILGGDNQVTASLIVAQGVVNIRSSSALGTASAGTTVNLGAQLQLEGNLNILAESITASGMGPGAGAYGVGMG